MRDRVSTYIRTQLDVKHALIFALIDAENLSSGSAGKVAFKAAQCGVDAILVGGSTASDQLSLDVTVKDIRNNVTVPVILFPGNITGISPSADAILFTSLLNSEDPYFIIGAQALGATLVKKYGLEALPTGYIIAGEGAAAGFIGKARPFPPNKPELVALYALAAEYLGMKFVYLEAGSGANAPITSTMVKTVRSLYEGTLIVGGGIRDPNTARSIVDAGANIIVVGNLLETEDFEVPLTKLVAAVHGEISDR
jgi:phosphoglycerol geranylgeranyltransferase